MSNELLMTRAEREELAKVVRMRARVAKADVDAHKAKLLADFEEQVATEYDMHDERWAKYVREGEAAVAVANEAIRRAFDESGIPDSFAPSASVGWSPRGGEWIRRDRRNELRNVAAKRLDAQAKAARVEVDRAAVGLLSELAAAALTTEQARAWLERLPSTERLMPRLRLVEIEAATDEESVLQRRVRGW